MKIIKLNKKYTNLDKLKLTYRTYNLDIGNNQYETVIYTRYNDCVFLIILNTHDAKERDSLFEKLQEVINNMKPLDKNDQ
ncbi:MAG: hypothetical protein LBV69_03880 [Bacteroidales bacterium]|jgi:hypothetical protein|nr:hypothetical protein [Bacteroidales bacterium]